MSFSWEECPLVSFPHTRSFGRTNWTQWFIYKEREVAKETEEFLGGTGKAEVREVRSMDKIKVHCIHLYIDKK